MLFRSLQFKFQAVPTGSAGTCHFADKWMVSMVTHLIGYLHIKYGLLFFLNSVGAFWQKPLVDASQKLVFRLLENGKLIFCSKKMKTPFVDTVCHWKIHTCAQCGAIITNYLVVKVMTNLILLDSHATSNIEGHL